MLNNQKKSDVLLKIKSTVDKINGIYNFDMKYPNFFWDVIGTNAGLAKRQTMSIHFNRHLALNNWEDFIENTVPHEICHLAVWHWADFFNKPTPKAHGSAWKLMMWEVGAKAKRTHDYDVSEVKRNNKIYLYSCKCEDKKEISSIIHKRIESGRVYKCTQCNTILKNGVRKLNKLFSKPSPNGTTNTKV